MSNRKGADLAAGGPTSTVGYGFPSPTSRATGDLHYNRTDGREYVLGPGPDVVPELLAKQSVDLNTTTVFTLPKAGWLVAVTHQYASTNAAVSVNSAPLTLLNTVNNGVCMNVLAIAVGAGTQTVSTTGSTGYGVNRCDLWFVTGTLNVHQVSNGGGISATNVVNAMVLLSAQVNGGSPPSASVANETVVVDDTASHGNLNTDYAAHFLATIANDYVNYSNAQAAAVVTVDPQTAPLTWLPTAAASASLAVQDENVTLSAAVSQIDFQGVGVTAALGAGGEIVVTVPGGGAGGGTATPVSGVQVGSALSQSLPNATEVPLTFENEVFDTDGFHSTTVNTDRLTVPVGGAGKYMVVAHAGISTNGGGRRYIGAMSYTSAGVNKQYFYGPVSPAYGGAPTHLDIVAVFDLADGDYVLIKALQDSGGTLATAGGYTDAAMMKISGGGGSSIPSPAKATRVRLASDLAFGGNGTGTVAWASTDFDDETLWSATAPSRLTIKRAGTYLLKGMLATAAAAAYTGRWQAVIFKNGVNAIGGVSEAQTSAAYPYVQVEIIDKAVPGDYYELRYYLSAAGTFESDVSSFEIVALEANTSAAPLNPASEATVATTEATSSSAYTDLATAGPVATVTVGASGKAVVFLSADVYSSVSGNYIFAGVAVSGATTRAANYADAIYVKSTAAGMEQSGSVMLVLTGLTPGVNTFTMKYRTDNNSATYLNRRILVVPWENLQGGGGTAAAPTGDTTWTNATLVGTWTSYGSTYSTPGYRKSGEGIVRLRGVLTSGTSHTTALNLPAGYRPSADVLLGAPSGPNSDVLTYIVVTTAGAVILGASTSTVSLDGVSFYAA